LCFGAEFEKARTFGEVEVVKMAFEKLEFPLEKFG